MIDFEYFDKVLLLATVNKANIIINLNWIYMQTYTRIIKIRLFKYLIKNNDTEIVYFYFLNYITIKITFHENMQVISAHGDFDNTN